MGRARLVRSSWRAVPAVSGTSAAQTTAPPDGWVVLPVDEYRALRERANPPPPPPAPPPVDATLTRVDYDLRVDGEVDRRPRAADDRRAARRLDARADSRGADGARRAPRRPAGVARRGPAAARAAVARRPRRAHARHRRSRSPRRPAPNRSRCPRRRRRSRAPRSTLPRSGVDLVGGRRLHRRARRDADREPLDRVRPPEPGADVVVEAQGRRSPRGAAAARARARARQSSGSAKTLSRWPPRCASRSLQGLAREVALALPPGLVVNQVNGATVARLGARAAACCACGCSSRRPPKSSFVVQGETRAPRDGVGGRAARARAVGRARNRRRRRGRRRRRRDRASARRAGSNRRIRPSSASSSPAASRRR